MRLARAKLGALAGFIAVLLMCWLVFKLKLCSEQRLKQEQEYEVLLMQLKKTTPKPKIMLSNIIFLETSRRKVLKARISCALESAALHNPEMQIQHYSIEPIASDDIYRMALQNVTNIKFHILDIKTLYIHTPLYMWHISGALENSTFPIHHLSDAVRLAILWKHGGIYLDTDVISIRPLGNFFNALGYDYGQATNSVLVFQKKHPFLMLCMQDFARNYSPFEYDHHGPGLVTRVLQSICNDNGLCHAINNPDKCKGVTLLPENVFTAFAWQDWKRLFDKAEKVNTLHSYTVHTFSKMSGDTTGLPGDGSLLDILSKNNCPTIYQMMVAQNKL